jgi:hypothetical protein
MIHRNGRVFISHTPQDEGYFTSLVSRLSEREIDCWSRIQPGDSDTQLSPKTLAEIAERDVFLRICTPAAAASPRMHLEAAALRAKAQIDQERGTPNKHIIIDLVMDPAYIPDPADTGYLTINTTNRPMNDWLVVLYNESGKMQATRAMGRRSMTVVVTVCVVGGFIVVVALLAFLVLFQGVIPVP